MITFMLENYMFYYIIGIVAAFGIISKLITYASLKKMVKASSDMGKSEHTFMKMVRQKFEHACMVSDKVQNVGAFVDKYLYECRILRLRLHSWRQLEKIALWLCVLLGALGAGLEFAYYGMNETVFRYGVWGAATAIVQFLLHVAQDEKYQLNAAKTYMVDFLENVYSRRYEKIYLQKQESVATSAVTATAAAETVAASAKTSAAAEKTPSATEKTPAASAKTPAASVKTTATVAKAPAEVTHNKMEKEVEKEAEGIKEQPEEEYPQAEAIREILEEFLA
ncbi:MAG: hypothetical protein ACRC3H_15165 [Lachnospiraceae bacterium]